MDIQALYAYYLQHRLISTDTRKIIPGSIFFALKGEHFDGNQFAEEAIIQGAVLAVVSDASIKGDKFFYVSDTLIALQALAHHHRVKINVPVIAITGSNGKTTTKELISEVLSTTFNVSATAGNFNNHIGVPLTILSVHEKAEIIVCEMGANHLGEIKLLSEIAAPTHGIITNIGSAHLEGFGSIEGVKKAKGELFDYLFEHQGYGFVNIDDAKVEDLGQKLQNKTTFGFDQSKHPDILLKYTSADGEKGFTLKTETDAILIQSQLFGKYNASNMLAAYTIGLHFGIDQNQLVNVLSKFVSKSNRSEEISLHGCKFIMDAYNANPSSMELSIRAFAEKHPSGWVILGDMKELGQVTQESHQKIITLVSNLRFEKVVYVGEAFSKALQSAPESNSKVSCYDNIAQLKRDWEWSSCGGQTIFVKGSRSMELELILK